jgi:pyruvate dehydrogenase E2 component (dihydrolipoamide acetyltransferase)
MLRRAVFRTWTPAVTARFVTITPLAMPALSPTMLQGNFASWVKQVGEEIKPGDELAKIETDKATVSFDNVGDEGFMARHLIENGTNDVKVGTVVALLVENKADIDSDEVKNWKPEGGESKPAPAKEEKKADTKAEPKESSSSSSKSASESKPQQQRGDGERVFASPLARKMAGELGVDLSSVSGTGGNVGRVTKEDVLKASKEPKAASKKGGDNAAEKSEGKAHTKASSTAAAPAGESELFEKIAVTSMRRTIATRLTQSKNVEVPHYYLMQECKADAMLTVIKQLNAKGKGEFKITVNDYIIKAIARANLIVPECNTHWHGDHMRRYQTVDVSVAVATPTGLITPIVRDAHAKGLAQISQEVKALAKQAKDGTLQPAQYQGGTVSVSNMGGMGIERFTAIINNPQSMILAVGSALPKPALKQTEDGEWVMTGQVEQVINFSASFDHRVVDGAVGALWFKHFKDAVENPLSLLL